MTVRVVLADDQAVVRLGFRMVLDPEPDLEVVAEAADGRAAVEAARRSRADVVIMDVRMPVLDGISAPGCWPDRACRRRWRSWW